jgi:hypothetical protein
MFRNSQLADLAKIVAGLGPVAPSSSTPDYVSLKNYDRATIVIQGLNGTTVTGSAITLLQATSVAAGGEKALPFSTVMANTDCAAGDTLAAAAVSSNTFTTTNTNSKQFMYVIDVKASDLDVANGFDCIRAGTANAVNSTISVTYILHPARYSSPAAVAAITD